MSPARHGRNPEDGNGDALPRPVAALLRRLETLSAEDQLLAYKAIATHLRAGLDAASLDPELDERAEALRVMRVALAHLGIDNPRKLTAKQFDGAPEQVREGWRSGRVIRAWVKWRFACAALAGETPRLTARQRGIRGRAGVTRVLSDDYIPSVQAWLAEDPPQRKQADYDRWAIEQRAKNTDGGFPYPAATTIRKATGYPWETIFKIASGELTIAHAKKQKIVPRLAIIRGAHNLVSSTDIVEMSGKNHGVVQYWLRRPGFPTPVLVIKDRYRFYLREDVQAFLSKKPFPNRTRNELGETYIARDEAARITGLSESSLSDGGKAALPGRPEPIARVGRVMLWLRSDIEAWAAERKSRGASGRKMARESKLQSGTAETRSG